MSRIGSVFGAVGDLISTFIFSFLTTSKLEKLPDLALFQRYRGRRIFKPIRGKNDVCVHINLCVYKCIVYCVPKRIL